VQYDDSTIEGAEGMSVPAGDPYTSLWQGIAAFSGSPCAAFVFEGFQAQSPINNQGIQQSPYNYFESWQQPSGGWGLQFTPYSANGNSFVFSDLYRGNATYTFLVNNTPETTVMNMGFGSCLGQVGLSVFSPDGLDNTFYSNTFDFTGLEWFDSHGNVHPGFTHPYSTPYYYNYPCGGSYGNVYCMNGDLYSSAHWADNLPLVT
jgi:hypothetical protein